MKTANLSTQLDGRTTFTLPEAFKTNSLRVYYNGVRETTSVTEISNSQFQFDFSPQNGAGVELIVDYVPL
jgi:hypothetical protein